MIHQYVYQFWSYWYALLTKKQVKPNSNCVGNHLLFCNHSAYYDDSEPWEPKAFTRTERVFSWREIDHLWIGTLHWYRCTDSKRPSVMIFVRISFVLNSCYITFIQWLSIILSFITAWAPPFVKMVLFDLISFWSHETDYCSCHEWCFAYCNICSLIVHH